MQLAQKVRNFAISVPIALVMVNCGGGDSQASQRQLVSIAVQPNSGHAIAPTGTLQFSATGTFSQPPLTQTNLSLQWVSANPSVASIGAYSGNATCVSAGGQITITASATGSGGLVSGTATLNCLSESQIFKTELNFTGANGGYPHGALVQGPDGELYGTDQFGGTGSNGTVYRLNSLGDLTVLYNFCTQANCADGWYSGDLVLATDGNFYGTTSRGGAGTSCSPGPGCGVVFQVTPTGLYKNIYSFCVSDIHCSDGSNPSSGLIQASDGNFYGLTGTGGTGAGPGGTVFRITSEGALTTIYNFCSQATCADGAFPGGALVQGKDGNFYGTTTIGGDAACNCGTVFRLTAQGALTTLYRFHGTDGSFPQGGLIQATDGNFYGTTTQNGSTSPCITNCGTIFKMTPGGSVNTFYVFGSNDGYDPTALIQGTDGNLYGTTYWGGGDPSCGPAGCGTAYQITLSGLFTTLHRFQGIDGNGPDSSLVQGANGIFYGTTSLGGLTACLQGCGTVFSLDLGL